MFNSLKSYFSAFLNDRDVICVLVLLTCLSLEPARKSRFSLAAWDANFLLRSFGACMVCSRVGKRLDLQ